MTRNLLRQSKQSRKPTNAGALSLPRLLEAKKWDKVVEFLCSDAPIGRDGRNALAEHFFSRRKGRRTDATTDEQDRLRWARRCFHELRLEYLEETGTEKIARDVRRLLATEVVIEANCHFPGPKKLTLVEFMGSKEGETKNAPANRPIPKLVQHPHLRDERAEAVMIGAKRRIRKTLRSFGTKSKLTK